MASPVVSFLRGRRRTAERQYQRRCLALINAQCAARNPAFQELWCNKRRDLIQQAEEGFLPPDLSGRGQG